MRALLVTTLGAVLAACPAPVPAPAGPPPCGSHRNEAVGLIPGPGRAGFDATLAAAARRHDRQFHALNAFATGLNAELVVRTDDASAKADIERFVRDLDGFDFEAATGRSPLTLGQWTKSAGLYAGAGIAADVYRYAVLRDDGDDCAEVELARTQVVKGLEALDTAVRITGVPGVMARSLLRTDVPASQPLDTVPLFDGNGQSLPTQKNNGTWRADNSAQHPTLIWEDSLSRDMLVGWALAFGAQAEALEGDATIPDELRARLREDAKQVGLALQKVGADGFDLEIPDADGRITYNGYLNENAIDRVYLAGADNGANALMSLGIVGALTRASGDAVLQSYLVDTLVAQRRLDRISDVNAHLVDMGTVSNFSNYNMVFLGGYLGQRFVPGDIAGRLIRRAIRDELYARPEQPLRQPREQKQTLYDFIYVAAALPEGDALTSQRQTALANGLETLHEFPEAPVFDEPRINCDDAEILAGSCTLNDGTVVPVLGMVGRGDALVSEVPIPMRVRPRSNFSWRSNPYAPNDSSPVSGTVLFSAVDFRLAYWLGRWLHP